jgi:hypothetical protein
MSSITLHYQNFGRYIMMKLMRTNSKPARTVLHQNSRSPSHQHHASHLPFHSRAAFSALAEHLEGR